MKVVLGIHRRHRLVLTGEIKYKKLDKLSLLSNTPESAHVGVVGVFWMAKA